MAYGDEQGFGNAGAPTVQPETEEERRRRLGQDQNFQQPQAQGAPVTGVRSVNGQWNNGGAGFNTGVSDDVTRYRDMAAGKLGRQGPQINQGQSNESRGLQTEGLGMLEARARGGITPAQYMMGQQTRGAVAGIQSNAASIRGGAMARAAASRGAASLGARVQAQGDQDRQALAAREQADAAGQLFGAANQQREADIGLATDQSKLAQQQRGLDAQRQVAYESLGYDVKNAALGASLGRTAADQAAANTARQQGQAESNASWSNMKDVSGTVVGGAAGGTAAYAKTQQGGGEPKKPVYDYAGSDPRMKTKTKPITDKQARSLKSQGESMIEVDEQRTRDAGGSTVRTPGNRSAERGERESSEIVRDNPYASPREKLRSRSREGDYDRSMFKSEAEKETAPDREALHAGIEKQLAEDGDIIRENPYAPKTLFGGGTPGHAASRKDKPGYMFGGAPTAFHGFERQGPTHEGPAPGTEDFTPPKRYNNAKDQAISMSDPRAKQEAFQMGVNYGRNPEGPSTKKGDSPETKEQARKEWEAGRSMAEGKASGKAEGPAGAVGFSAKRPEAPKGREMQSFTRERPAQPGALERGMSGLIKHGGIIGPGVSGNPIYDAAEAGARGAQQLNGDPQVGLAEGVNMGINGLRDAPPPTSAETMMASTQHAGRGGARPAPPPMSAQQVRRDFVGDRPNTEKGIDDVGGSLSDPRTKKVGDESPMADAMRAMEPSSYEYKPEFAKQEGQAPGDKNVGPMADKMKADPVARTAIVTDPNPPHLLAIDKSKGLKLALGGLSDLQRQIDQMKRRSA